MWKCQICGEEIEDQFDSCWKCAKPIPDSIPAASAGRCLNCHGPRVVAGRVVDNEGGATAVFQPDNLRMLASVLKSGTRLSEESFACLDCGLVWSSTRPEALAEFMQKHCG
jgi:hypothetical protein